MSHDKEDTPDMRNNVITSGHNYHLNSLSILRAFRTNHYRIVVYTKSFKGKKIKDLTM